MTISSIERKIRANLPIIRFMQEHIPLPVAHFFLRLGITHAQLGADVIRETASVDGVPCEWIIPPNSLTDRVLLYLHGGGFVFGLTPPHLQMVATSMEAMRTHRCPNKGRRGVLCNDMIQTL